MSDCSPQLFLPVRTNNRFATHYWFDNHFVFVFIKSCTSTVKLTSLAFGYLSLFSVDFPVLVSNMDNLSTRCCLSTLRAGSICERVFPTGLTNSLRDWV